MKLASVLPIIFLAVIFPASLCAQTRCTEVFHAKYGGPGKDEGQAVVYTRNGDVAVAGNTNSVGTAGTDGFIMLLGPGGNLLWSKYYGNAGEDFFYRLKQTPDDGFIAVGTSVLPGYPDGLLWVVKTDAAGNISWSRKMHFGTTDRIKGVDVVPLSTGGYAVAANVNDSSARGDVLITRLNDTGDPVWTKRFDEGHDEGVLTIVQDGGDLLAAGYTDGDFRDAFLMRINLTTGNVTNARKFTAVPGSHEEGAAIEIHPGGINLTLKTYPPYGPLDTYDTGLSVITAHLDMQWNIVGGSVKTLVQTSNGSGRTTYARIKPVPGDGLLIGVYSDNPLASQGTLVWVDRTGRSGMTMGYNHQEGTMMDVDVMGDAGWVGAGSNRNEGGDFDIGVTKSDRMGKVGFQGCETSLIGVWENSEVNVTGNAYTWSSELLTVMVLEPETPVQQTGTFTMTFNQCGATLCKPLPPTGSGATCTKGLFTRIKDDFQTETYDAVRMDDGDIMALTYRNFSPVYFFSQLVKLKPDGTVRWAKHIVLDHTITKMKFAYRLRKLRDNSILVYGIGSLMKIDQNGLVVWSREVNYPSGGGTYGFNSSVEAENGDIILGMAHGLIRIDGAAGNIVWENRIDFQGGGPFFRGLVCDNGFAYLALEYPRQHPNAYVAVLRFNAADGSMSWSKQFSHPGKDMDVLHLMKSGDVLTLSVGLYSEISSLKYDYRLGAVRLNATSGQQIDGWRLTDKMLVRTHYHMSNSEFQPVHMDRAAGDSLIFAHETSVGTDTTIRVMKFSTDGKLAWIRNYPNLKASEHSSIRADGEGMLITANFFPRKMREIEKEGFVMRTNRNGVIEGATAGDCYSVLETGTIVPMALKEDVPTAIGASVITEGQLVAAKVFTDPVLAVFAIPSCEVPANCLNISVSGPDKICDLAADYTYRATKDAGCDEPVVWSIDGTIADIISQSGDVLIVRFKKVGVVPVTASIDGGCKVITGTVTVEVAKTAATADLGPDKILCEGNSTELDPGDGYSTYRWHNGATDRTFTATAPGDYRVTVTDVCNNTYTEEITLLPAPDYAFSLGGDIRKCPEAVITIDIPQGFNNYSWNTDFSINLMGTRAELSPDRDTAYILVAEKEPGCFVRDTVRVSIISPMRVSLGADTDLCAGDSLFLQVPPGLTDVIWSTGQRDYSIYARTAGQFTVSAKDQEGCATFDTLMIGSLLPLPVTGLPRNGILCEGTSTVLRAASGASWLWSTGEQTPSITVSQPGKWWVKVEGANGCKASDTLEIAGITANPSGFLPDDMEICRQSNFILQANENFVAYRWNTGDPSPGIPIRQPGIYWLEVTDANGCRGRDEVDIKVKDCITAVWFPNAFTPNHDGRHDIFRPVVKGELEYYQLQIFHRWGNLVFASKDPSMGWNGLIQELPAPPGSYIWICEYTLKGAPKKQDNGSVLLMR